MRQSRNAVTEFVSAWTTLIGEGARLGADVLRSSMTSMGAMMPAMEPRMSHRHESSRHTCSCTTPPACWMPVCAGDVETSGCPGATAVLRVRVTNCGATARDITIEPAKAASGVSVSPSTLHLGSMEEGTALLTFAIPADADDGKEYEALVWVRGCKSHYLRWRVTAGERGRCSETLSIEDCPDTIHHWYDHFYCQHPCAH